MLRLQSQIHSYHSIRVARTTSGRLVEFFLAKHVGNLRIDHKCRIKDNVCNFLGKLLFKHLCQQCESDCAHISEGSGSPFVCKGNFGLVCAEYLLSLKEKRQLIRWSSGLFPELWQCLSAQVHSALLFVHFNDFDKFPDQIRMGGNALRCLWHLSFLGPSGLEGRHSHHCAARELQSCSCAPS